MLEARRLAATTKRLDICAAQFAMLLHVSNRPTLADKVCLEIGSGWVLSHAAVCYLLGARRVIATDVARLASPMALGIAVRQSVASLVRDVLSPFGDREMIRERLDELRALRRPTLKDLSALGIEYVAPFDLSRHAPQDQVDFLYSLSVLEHVPPAHLSTLLAGLTSALRPGGEMLHCLHLEDHRNPTGDPFGFLAVRDEPWTQDDCWERGNRVRSSRWRELAEQQPGLAARVVYEWRRTSVPIPRSIDPTIAHAGQSDLCVGHLGLYGVKQGV